MLIVEINRFEQVLSANYFYIYAALYAIFTTFPFSVLSISFSVCVCVWVGVWVRVLVCVCLCVCVCVHTVIFPIYIFICVHVV